MNASEACMIVVGVQPRLIHFCFFACIYFSLNSGHCRLVAFLLPELSTLSFGGLSLSFLLPKLSTLTFCGLSLSFVFPEFGTRMLGSHNFSFYISELHWLTPRVLLLTLCLLSWAAWLASPSILAESKANYSWQRHWKETVFTYSYFLPFFGSQARAS